ncbi:MAG: hypothetical protein GJT30_03695 [Geobacter sp.]|nr:hypothetical protein [Geobacter sp.]
MKTKLLSTVVIFVVLMLGAFSPSWALDVDLQWDANTEADLAGYKVYYKTDSSTLSYDGVGAVEGVSPIDVHNLTTATISGLDPSLSYTFAVTAYNTNGVESVYSDTVYVPESQAPTVSITSPTNSSNVSGTISVSISAADNVGVTRVEYYVNNVLQATDTVSPYVFSWDTLSVSPGVYTLSARAYDTAGNIGQSGNISVTVMNDVTAPAVAISSPSTGATVSGAVTVTASATDNVGVSRVEFYESGILRAAVNSAPYSYSWNTTAVSNGTYTLYAKAYDNTGNSAQSANVSVTVNNADTTVPTVAISSPSASATVSGTVAVSATAADNIGVSRVEFYVNNVLQATDTSSPYSFSWNTTAVTNGSYTLSARAYDAAGNVGQSANVSVTVNNADTTVPTVAISSPSASATVSGTVAVSATAADNIGVSRVEFYVNNVLQTTDTSSPYSFSWNTTAVTNGSYTLSARAYDAAGNSSQFTVIVTVFNDTVAPILTVNQVSTPTTSTTQLLSGTVSDNNAVASVTVQVGTKVPVSAVMSGNTWSYTLTGLVTGTNTIIIRATDPVGNSTAITKNIIVETTSAALTIADAMLALQNAVGKVTLSSDQLIRLDVAPIINGVSVPNGKVDTGDAIVILSKVVGKIAL